jgi:hypothetical protein
MSLVAAHVPGARFRFVAAKGRRDDIGFSYGLER